MQLRLPPGVPAAAVAVGLLGAFQAATGPEDGFAGLVKAYYALGQPADWEGIE